MAKLNKREQEVMEQLKAKMEAPDEAPIGKSVNFSLDLSDDNQIKKAQRLGLLPGFDDDDDDDSDDDDDDKKPPDDTPRRRSYFKE